MIGLRVILEIEFINEQSLYFQMSKRGSRIGKWK